MARPLRIEFPGALYHVTARGNARQDIYLDAEDSQRFLDLFGEVCQRCDWHCYAYCLMTNHYHLVVETAAPNLSAGMRQLNGRYTQTFNRRHRRAGHLFQGRYMAILVDREAYLKQVCRYVLLNPVRAGLTTEAWAWRWSSYRATIRGGGPSWLATPRLLDLFGASPRAAAGAFAAFVAEGAGAAGQSAGLWDNLTGQIYLGSAGFVGAMQSRAGVARDSAEVPRAQRRGPVLSLGAFVERYADTREAMARAYLEGGYSQATVARHFNVHYSTVSRAARQIERALKR